MYVEPSESFGVEVGDRQRYVVSPIKRNEAYFKKLGWKAESKSMEQFGGRSIRR